jgi:nitroreductase
MNVVLEAILGWRSVWLFKGDLIELDELETLVEAGRYAPSASNSQDWFFTVVQSRER